MPCTRSTRQRVLAMVAFPLVPGDGCRYPAKVRRSCEPSTHHGIANVPIARHALHRCNRLVCVHRANSFLTLMLMDICCDGVLGLATPAPRNLHTKTKRRTTFKSTSGFCVRQRLRRTSLTTTSCSIGSACRMNAGVLVHLKCPTMLLCNSRNTLTNTWFHRTINHLQRVSWLGHSMLTPSKERDWNSNPDTAKSTISGDNTSRTAG